MQHPPWMYELACYGLDASGNDDLRQFYQGWAETEAEAIAIGQTALDVGHPDPAIVKRWQDRGVVEADYSPWVRVVVYWAQFDPDREFQDLTETTNPVADLRRAA